VRGYEVNKILHACHDEPYGGHYAKKKDNLNDLARWILLANSPHKCSSLYLSL